MKIKELPGREFFLFVALTPLFLCLVLLLTNVKAPSELFKEQVKKIRPKASIKVHVKTESRPEQVVSSPLKSLSSSLASPKSAGSDLNSLSAGVVSESSGGGGSGFNVIQGDVNAGEMAKNTGGEKKSARAINVVEPVYPQSARARGLKGQVLLEIQISERGSVSDVRVISSNPTGIFDQAALDAVRKWSFQAAIEDGKPVSSIIKQRVNFELSD